MLPVYPVRRRNHEYISMVYLADDVGLRTTQLIRKAKVEIAAVAAPTHQGLAASDLVVSRRNAPADGVHHVTDRQQAYALAEHLPSPTREMPVVLVTVPVGDGFHVDARRIAAEVAPHAQVYELATGPGDAGFGGEAGGVPRFERQHAQAKKTARDTQSKLSQLTRKQSSGGVLDDRDADLRAFADPEAQFRYEVDLAYARRIPAAEKPALPLRQYRVLPGLLETLTALDARDRAKAVEVAVEIATWRVHDIHGRQTHQLRTGSGPDDPILIRDDGASCWRVYLQHKTPQARRVHFWMPSDRVPELSSVRQHDDLRP